MLDLDQAELALNPTRTRVWAPVGVPWEVETPGNNRKQVMFGAVNSRSGQTHFRLSAHKRSLDFQQFVDHAIIPAYPQADFIFLIVDGASIYKSKSTLAWLKERPQIVLVPLPSYAPKLSSTCRNRSGAGCAPRSPTTISSARWTLSWPPPSAFSPKWPSNRRQCSAASAAASLHWNETLRSLRELH